MPSPSHAPDPKARIAELERRLANIERDRAVVYPHMRDLADAELWNVANGQAPVWDKALGKWIPGSAGHSHNGAGALSVVLGRTPVEAPFPVTEGTRDVSIGTGATTVAGGTVYASDGRIAILGTARAATDIVIGAQSSTAAAGGGNSLLGYVVRALGYTNGAVLGGYTVTATDSDYPVGIGQNMVITAGHYAVALGEGVGVTATHAVAIGQGATVSVEGGTALGHGAVSDLAKYQVAIGRRLSGGTSSDGMGSVFTRGARVCSVRSITAALTIPAIGDGLGTTKAEHIFVDTAGGAVTVTLPAAVLATLGQRYTVKHTDAGANAVTLAAAGADLIDGAASVVFGGGARSARTVIQHAVGAWSIVGVV